VAELVAEMRIRKGGGAPSTHDPVKRFVDFLDETGRPRRLSYVVATFAFGPGNVITPHAHRHMASAHMVIEGRVRIRTFDRVADQGGALVIRPTGDKLAEVGEATAMTTARDNVHWFTPATARATTFDVIVTDLDRGQPSYLIEPVDPLGGEHRPDGTILAPVISFEDSAARYPASV
jgi:predicted metal-dependent enzyme (double-stranded beta helix superfamily)